MIGFDDFLKLVRQGRSPYPWQREFAHLAANDRPPDIVDVPTGCGKTTVIEALVWALAEQAERPGFERTVGVRTVWAIDRRILVDEVYEQARALAELLSLSWLQGDPNDPLFEVAKRLQGLKRADETIDPEILGPPLLVSRWRGGVEMSPPSQHPLQAEIITSTVGQIGSRMLFRGFGLGSASRQTGAALAACDTTICLDEAHLAEPFAETIGQVAGWRREEPNPVAPPVSIVRLSATLSPEATTPASSLGLSPSDQVVLRPRLEAPKQATLVEPDGQSDKDQMDALVAAISGFIEDGATKVACVCNSVRTARSVFDQLARNRTSLDRMLLVGPQRPADRQGIFDARIAPDDTESSDGFPSRREVLFEGAETEIPLVLVATQTVEVGLDIDVDAMVTQSASAVAMVQRFGRVNRAGTPGKIGRITVVRQPDFPLYEFDEEAAWQWLSNLPTATDSGAVDVSVRTLSANPPPASLRRNPAPALTDDVMDRLVETNPLPHQMAEPDIDVFLYGVHSEPNNDVSICWRSDLREHDESATTYRDALLRLAPPDRSEQLSISLNAARNLLRSLTGLSSAKGSTLRRQVLDGADLEGQGPAEAGFDSRAFPERFEGIPYFVLRDSRWLPGYSAGVSGGETVGIGQLKPGDLIVLPTALGGFDEFGIAIGSSKDTDVAADLRPAENGAEIPIRLTHGALEIAFSPNLMTDGRLRRINHLAGRLADLEQGTDDFRDLATKLLSDLAGHPAIENLDPASMQIRRLSPVSEFDMNEFLDLGEGFDPPDGLDDRSPGAAAILDGEDEPGSVLGGWILLPTTQDPSELRPQDSPPPTLRAHGRAVAGRAGWFASAASLDQRLIDTLTLAGLAHDLGKADPRMQGLFHGGVAPAVGELLAKSQFGLKDRSRDHSAREASGMPIRLRHEQASVGVLRDAIRAGDNGDLAPDKVDLDLLLHLVGSHHGKNHPVPPIPIGGSPPRPFRVSLDGLSGVANGDGDDGWEDGESLARSTRLRSRLGVWSLAYLEALLVLADRTVSSEGK
ncbi:MAG TPA: type I-U CRISPR-associated helicase/endonuclease Cas3 [Solirubrobacterales bacterium]|nr:type I-U CRISPR-associated helicase/endonuclease Cas3 [Solirubrobacterales bacterium]